MHLSKFVHSESGKYIMSIILGIGLATLFRVACKGNNCIITQAPPLEEIKEKTYRIDGKCYKIESNAVSCNSQKQIVEFA
jgi:hypothetical protein